MRPASTIAPVGGDAHHGGDHGDRHLEVGQRVAGAAADAPVVEIHHAVRAGLQLGEARRARRRCRTCPVEPPATISTGRPAFSKRARVSISGAIAAREASRRAGPAHHVRAVPGVALQAAQPQRALLGHEPAERQRRLARLDAGAPGADVDVHQHVERHARPRRRRAPSAPHVVGMVDHDHRVGRVADQPREAADRGRRHDLGGDEQAPDAGRAITSASPSLAQATPSAPAAICRRAISGQRWVLACGRRFLPAVRTWAAMRARLRSKRSRSSRSAGVGISSRCMAWTIPWPGPGSVSAEADLVAQLVPVVGSAGKEVPEDAAHVGDGVQHGLAGLAASQALDHRVAHALPSTRRRRARGCPRRRRWPAGGRRRRGRRARRCARPSRACRAGRRPRPRRASASPVARRRAAAGARGARGSPPDVSRSAAATAVGDRVEVGRREERSRPARMPPPTSSRSRRRRRSCRRPAEKPPPPPPPAAATAAAAPAAEDGRQDDRRASPSRAAPPAV